jgi:hypothetical protein
VTVAANVDPPRATTDAAATKYPSNLMINPPLTLTYQAQ